MNGKSEAAVFKWCHDEIEAFRTRCVFLKMNIPLHHRINRSDFKFLAESGKEFIYISTKSDINLRETDVLLLEIIPRIFVLVSSEKKTASVSEPAILIY